jgi:hypothetical protein
VTTTATVETIKAMEAFELARIADCASPDTSDSPGAKFLLGVRDAVVDELTHSHAADGYDLADILTEIAENAPSVYTHERWQEFVDLCAYTEDVTEFGSELTMTSLAAIALHQIAYRLAAALCVLSRGRAWRRLRRRHQAHARRVEPSGCDEDGFYGPVNGEDRRRAREAAVALR